MSSHDGSFWLKLSSKMNRGIKLKELKSHSSWSMVARREPDKKEGEANRGLRAEWNFIMLIENYVKACFD